MAGATQVGALVINMAADVATLKTDMGAATRVVESSAQKMVSDLGAMRKSIESAIDPLKALTVNFGSLESQMGKAQSAALSLGKGLILGAAAGMSIDAIKNKIMGVIESMANLKTLSEKTGSSVENLSKLGFIAKQSGSDIDSVAIALGRMSKGMAGADDETKGAGLAMSFLGVKATDMAGKLKDPSTMFTEIAQKLNGYQDGAGKAAIAQALFGKAGADMLPTLKLLGEQGDMVAKTTDAQATAARQYVKDVAKLDAQKNMLFKTIAVALLPTMTDFVSVMIDASKETNVANGAVKKLANDSSITDWADAAAMGMARLIDVIKVLPAMFSAVAGSGKAVLADIALIGQSALMLNPMRMAKSVASGENPFADMKVLLDNRNKTLADANSAYDKLWNMEGNATEQAMAKRIAARQKYRAAQNADDAARAAAEAAKPTLEFKTGKGGKTKSESAKQEVSDYEKLIRVISEKTAVQEMELASNGALTDGEKMAAKFTADLRDNKLKLIATAAKSIDVQKQEITAGLEKLIADEKAVASKKEMLKLGDDMVKSGDASVKKIQEEIDKQREHNAEIGLTKDQIAALIARKEELTADADTELANNMRLAADAAGPLHDAYLQYADDLDKIAAKKREIAGLKVTGAAKEVAAEEVKQQQAEWTKFYDSIYQGLTDSLYRGFEAGKGFFQSFWDSIKNLFKTTVLKLAVQGVLSMTGLGGLAGAANAVTGGSSGGMLGVANNASSLNTLYGAGAQYLMGGSVGASGASLAAANGIGALGGDGLGALIVGNGGWAGVGATVGTSAATAAQAAIAANVALEAGTGVALASGTTAAAAGGTAAATGPLAAMGPVGWAALAAVAVAAYFGGPGKKEVTGTGISGQLKASGASDVQSYSTWKQDGGWFSSNKSGTDKSAISGELQKTLDTATTGITASTKAYATAIGMSADAVTGYTQDINVSLAGLDATKQQEAITKALGGFADGMASVYGGVTMLAKDGETASATLARLATSITSVNSWLVILRQRLLDVSTSGADAASKLADAMGGLDKLAVASQAYYDAYFTDAEKAADATTQMTQALAAVGLTLPASKAAFRDLASGLNLNTDAGRKAYAVMLTIAPAFSTAADNVAKLATATATKLMATFSGSSIDFAGLGRALSRSNIETFTATMALVFTSLAGRLTTLLGSIATERSAVSSAMLTILNPATLTRSQILAGIAGANVARPGGQGIASAQSGLQSADSSVAAASAALAYVKSQSPSTAAMDASAGALGVANQQVVGAQAQVNNYRTIEGGKFSSWLDQAFVGNDLRGSVPNPSGERNAQDSVFGLQAAQAAQQPAQADYNAKLAAYSKQFASYASTVASAQAKLTETQNAQSAAIAVARAAQVAYIASLQNYAIDASKATDKLGKLREETVKYYDQQKALTTLMTTSADGLRKAMLGAATTTLNATQSQRYQQGQFDQNYAMARVSSGDALAGYADKLAQALPALSASLLASSATASDYALSVAQLNARAGTVASALESSMSTSTYEADSLDMLRQIDAALAVLHDGAKGAERIIADAVKAGSDQTTAGLRAVVAALTGQSIPAFASGGYHAGGVRLVGENGPELEVTGPSRIFSAGQTRGMLGGGGDNTELSSALRSIADRLDAIEANTRAGAQHGSKTSRILTRVTRDGEALQTVVAA